MTEAAAEPKTEGHKNTVIEDARGEIRAAIRDLKSIRYRLLGVQGSIPPTVQETSLRDLGGELDLETEVRAGLATGIQDRLDPLIADLGTVADRLTFEVKPKVEPE